MKLANKVAVITGAGSGIGKAIALLFAREGAAVIAADIAKGHLEEMIGTAQKQGGKISAVMADVSREKDIQRMIDAAVREYGGLDILVNNAGILDNFTPAADLDDDLWERVLNVNLTGPFRACRKAIPVMIRQGGGIIINVSSVGGLFGTRGGTAYTVSKHGLLGLTKNVGYVYGDKGIRCNAICPGGVETAIAEGINPHPLGYAKLNTGLGSNPRMGKPEEIARIALFLASDDSSLVNGTFIVADAGWTAY